MRILDKVECRDEQLDLLDSFVRMGNLLDTLVIYGINSGKLTCVQRYFKARQMEPIYIDCQRIMSLTKLYTKVLERIEVWLADSKDEKRGSEKENGKEKDTDSRKSNGARQSNKCRDVSTFRIKLERLLGSARQASLQESNAHRFVVFTNYEQLPTSQLLNTIIGFNKIQQCTPLVSQRLSFVFILNIFDLQYQQGFKELANHAILSINFSTYTRKQIELILTRKTLISEMLLESICRFPDAGAFDTVSEPQKQIFWQDFVKLILDVFYQYTGSDIDSILQIIYKIWPIFTRKLFSGEFKISTDFIKLYTDNIKIFKESERFVMVDVNNDTFQVEPFTAHLNSFSDNNFIANDVVDLPVVSKLILCACYLAAYIPQKLDFQLFSKMRNVTGVRRKRRKTNTTGASKFLLNSSSFDMERMIAILFSIYENRRERNTTGNPKSAVNSELSSYANLDFAPLKLDTDFYAQVSNLISLEFLNKTFSSSVNDNIDLLNPKLKLKLNFDWDFIRRISQDVNISLDEYLVY